MTSSTKLIQAASGVGGDTDFYPYTVDNSIHLEPVSASNPILSRTIGAGSQTTFTWSFWVKPPVVVPSGYANTAQLGVSSGTVDTALRMTNNLQGAYTNKLWFYGYDSGYLGEDTTTSVFRDSSAWYHVVWVVDTTNATEADRALIYVNGERQPVSQLRAWPLNGTTGYGTAGNNMYITRFGYMADVILLDGTAASPTLFAEEKNGVWVPKDPSGLTFGTNGFWLDFADSAALGNDVSGNNNDFTSSGLAASDQMIDTPTNNFANLSIAAIRTGVTSPVLSDGNLEVAAPDSSGAITYWAFPSTGKYYYEIYYKTQVLWYRSMYMGISFADVNAVAQAGATDAIINFEDPSQDNAYKLWGTWTSGPGVSQGEFGAVLVDMDNNEVTLYRQGSATVTSSFPTEYIGKPLRIQMAGGGDNVAVFNFGQNGTFNGSVTAQGNTDANGIGDFYYTVPTDALALCAANFPEPTIGPNSATLTSEVFATVLYTGNGTVIGSGGLAVTGVGFQPDMVWIKNRDAADQWMVFDSVRGVTKYWSLDSPDIEVTDTETLSTFDADGFTLGSNLAVNTNTEDYVAFCFKITAGFFDIQSYSGTGVAKTEAHDLGVVPSFNIVKNLTVARSPRVYCESLPVTDPETDRLLLDGDQAVTDSATTWNDTAPTSAVITVGTDAGVNEDTEEFIVYLFANMEGLCRLDTTKAMAMLMGHLLIRGFCQIL
jgi:hypothetical protein